MALLKKHNETPPGGWTYFQRETEFTIKAENENQLVDMVTAHRQYRNLQPQDKASVQIDVERQICTRLGNLECKAEGKSDPWVPQNPVRNVVTMSMMLSFSKAAMAFAASGGELATMDEAKRRAQMCNDCPLAIPVAGCSCGTFYKAIEAVLPAERRFGQEKKVCMVCNCSVAVKLNLTEEQIVISNEGRGELPWPATPCYQKEIMERAKARAAVSNP